MAANKGEFVVEEKKGQILGEEVVEEEKGEFVVEDKKDKKGKGEADSARES